MQEAAVSRRAATGCSERDFHLARNRGCYLFQGLGEVQMGHRAGGMQDDPIEFLPDRKCRQEIVAPLNDIHDPDLLEPIAFQQCLIATKSSRGVLP